MGAGGFVEVGVVLAGELRLILEGSDGDFCEEMHGGFDLAVGVGI